MRFTREKVSMYSSRVMSIKANNLDEADPGVDASKAGVTFLDGACPTNKIRDVDICYSAKNCGSSLPPPVSYSTM